MFSQTILALAAVLPLTFAQISDDFESGWDKSKWPTYAPSCDQGGTVYLDSTVAHSGKNSMKVTGGSGGYCGHIFFGNNASIPSGGDVYVRTWLRHKTALPDAHSTFITMPDSGLGTDKHLRVSTQMEIFEYNRESDDATLPSLSPDGIAASHGIPTGTWKCLEYYLGSDGTIETWFNGDVVDGLTVKPGVTNANAGGWGTDYKPDISGVYFGWESYSGSVDTFWYDDVAIAASRIGCAVDGASSAASSATKAATSAVSTKAATSLAAPTTSSKAASSAKPTTSATSTAVASLSKAKSVAKPVTSSEAPPSVKPATSAASTPSATPSSAAPSTSAKPSTTLPSYPRASGADDSDCVINYVTVYV